MVELNLEVIPVKYGQELTHYKLESNISTKQLHLPLHLHNSNDSHFLPVTFLI